MTHTTLRHCPYCEESLPWPCRECGALLSPDFLLCPYCGTSSMRVEEPVPAKPAKPARQKLMVSGTTEKITVALPIAQADWLKESAARGDESMSHYLASLIEDHVLAGTPATPWLYGSIGRTRAITTLLPPAHAAKLRAMGGLSSTVRSWVAVEMEDVG